MAAEKTKPGGVGGSASLRMPASLYSAGFSLLDDGFVVGRYPANGWKLLVSEVIGPLPQIAPKKH